MLTTGERKQLKAATHLLVREAGGQEACAMASDRIERHQSFSEYADRSRLDRFICIDTVAEIERFAGSPILTRVLAELAGHVLIPLPVVPGSNARLDQITGRALIEIGEVFSRLGAARADGVICAAEHAELDDQVDEAVTMLLKLKHQIAAQAQAEADDA